MSIRFRLGKYVSPSGFGLAFLNIPSLDPENNISLVDKSYYWMENVATAHTSVIETSVDQDGVMPNISASDFVVTNVTTISTNDKEEVPLYYKHICRFHHYSYGENPIKQVYIVDQDENILKGINYLIKATRIDQNVYQIDILTDFKNNEYVKYKAKYNRCLSDGTEIYPSWVETLNVENLFKEGYPFSDAYEYTLAGPDSGGLYSVIVPPVPVISEITNSVGVSFENAPTFIKYNPVNAAAYDAGDVTYTLAATGGDTYTIQRDIDRVTGATSNEYLQSVSSDSWGAGAVNFETGMDITGIPGIEVLVYSDSVLKTGDSASFSASKSYYYLKPETYSTVYLAKPIYATVLDDWYLRIKNGRFVRRMDSEGNVVASGVGIEYEYAIPEYGDQTFDTALDQPYRELFEERVLILDEHNIQVKHTPIYIPGSDVLNNIDSSGFPPAGYMTVNIDGDDIPQDSIIDWDIYNGVVRLDEDLTSRDDILVTYHYEENFYEYRGFEASGEVYPDTAPFPYLELDLNPTPHHNYGMYGSGHIAHVFIKPYRNVDDSEIINAETTVYHNFTGTPSGVLDFELGTVGVGPACTEDNIEIIDIRTRGGGLNQRGIDEIEDVKDVQPEAEFFWDTGYFDGKAFPSNGVLVVNVPKTILSSNDGSFTEDEVRQKIMKHCAFGEYLIINYV